MLQVVVDEEHGRIVKLYLDCQGMASIAKTMGISSKTVLDHIREHD